jgi:integrase
MARRKQRARKGTGSVYLETGRGRSGNYMIAFTDTNTGKRRVMSSGTPVKAEAEAELARQLAMVANGEATTGTVVGRHAWDFKRAVEALRVDGINKTLSSRDYRLRRVEQYLTPQFGTLKLAEITKERVDAYTAARLKTGVARQTINSEVGLLRRMFILASEAGYHGPRPKFVLPNPRNAREGFFERHEYEAVLAHLPEYWQGPFTFAYITGWRLTSEIASLQWRQVDWRAGTVRLDPNTTKNDKGRVFPFAQFPELHACLQQAERVRKALAQAGRIVPWVFHRDGQKLVSTPGKTAAHRTGSMGHWARVAWHAACKAAGVTGRIPHDLRRTAVRNLLDAGMSEGMAMKLTGHETDTVFRRYHIINDNDLTAAVARYAAHMAMTR